MTFLQRIRERLGLPMKAGGSWERPDGSTLTYLGKALDPWDTKVCAVCKGPATQYKTLPPWPGTTYWHTSMTCDDHVSYLDGKGWSRAGGEWVEAVVTSGGCITCNSPYGSCEHTAGYAAIMAAQEAGATRGRV